MQNTLVFLLFVLAIASGFVLGVLQGQSVTYRWWRRFFPANSRRRYLTELSQLLAGSADAGIENFTEYFKVTPDTIDIHLAVGELLRKRGEVDKATQVHQNIIQSQAISPNQLQQAQLALAEDYLTAGLLDRAEILFKPLANHADKSIKIKSLKGLASIFEQEQEWLKAITAIDQLCQLVSQDSARHWRHLQAHFYCELADAGGAEERERMLAQAFKADANHNRANMLRVRGLCQTEPNKIKDKDLTNLSDQNGALAELIPTLAHAMGPSPIFIAWLEREQASHPTLQKAVYLADMFAEESGAKDEQALANFRANTAKDAQITRQLAIADCIARGKLGYQEVKQCLVSGSEHQFVCAQCGFQSHQYYWRCPTCKTWH